MRLLQLAFFGGSLGALVAQRRLRHKTQKQPFKSWLFAIAALHVVLGMATLVVALAPSVLAAYRP